MGFAWWHRGDFRRRRPAIGRCSASLVKLRRPRQSDEDRTFIKGDIVADSRDGSISPTCFISPKPKVRVLTRRRALIRMSVFE